MLSSGKVSHLDLSHRLISEQSWPTKRPGDGSHPDTLWTNDATSQTAPRSRVEIIARTLNDHSLNLQSLDASSNRFDAELSAYVERAGNVLQGPGMHAYLGGGAAKKKDKKGQSPTTGDPEKVKSPRMKWSSTRPATSPTGSPPGSPRPASPQVTEVQAELQRHVEEKRKVNEKRRRKQADRAAMLGADRPMKSVEELIKSLTVQHMLTTLDLSNNRIGLNGAKGLAEVLQEDKCKISTLSLAANRLGDKAILALAGALGSSRALTQVNLSDCAIGCAGAVELANYFEYNQGVAVLDLSWNHIRARGGEALAKCLASNQALTDFDLSWNGIGQLVIDADGDPTQPGAEQMGGAIADNTNLHRLDLAHNRIEEIGAFVIADGMDRNKTITQLVMDGNPVGQEGGRNLLRAIRELGDLRDISIRDCQMTSSDQKVRNAVTHFAPFVNKMYHFTKTGSGQA